MDDPEESVGGSTLSLPTYVATRWLMGKGRAWKVRCCNVHCRVDFCISLQVSRSRDREPFLLGI